MSLYVNWSDDFTYFSHVILIERYIITIAVSTTFTRDLETEGHIMFYVPFALSACMCPTAMI